VVFVDEYVILGTSQLKLCSKFWEQAVDVSMLIGFSKLPLVLAFSYNFIDESFVLDDLSEHSTCFLMTVDEGNNDVPSYGEVAEQETAEESTKKRCTRERLESSKVPAIGDNVCVNECPIF
tara:strand:- start:380 stop:742 length:363 start_codon:yes stop_codon:yes gene_type:complete